MDDIDLYVGGFLEKPNHKTSLGPTLECLVSQQFEKLKTGDRFFYTNPAQFTFQQLEEIKGQNLASILCAGADEPHKVKVQPNVFKLPSDDNKPKSCNEYPVINVEAWTERT